MTSPMGFSPALFRWPAPKTRDMMRAAREKAAARAWWGEMRWARPRRPRVRVYCRKPRVRYSSMRPTQRQARSQLAPEA